MHASSDKDLHSSCEASMSTKTLKKVFVCSSVCPSCEASMSTKT